MTRPPNHSRKARFQPIGRLASWIWGWSFLIGVGSSCGLGQTIVLLNQSSDPVGIVRESATPVASATSVSTVAASMQSGSYRFTHWTVNGVRQQDALGRASNPVAFTIYEPSDCVAHYVLASADSDGDKVPDWFEIHFYNSLTNAAESDTDGDGFTLKEEFACDYHPNLPDSVRDGSVSRRRSTAFWIIQDPTLVPYRLSSTPAGVISGLQVVAVGSLQTLPEVTGMLPGYQFGQWLVNGVRVEDALGQSYGGLTVVITNQTEAVAYFYRTDEDLDGDGFPDWFEWRHYGTLANGPESDTDGDGFTLKEEFVRGYHPNMADTIQDGGVSRRRSATFPLDLAGFQSFRVESTPVGILAQTTYVPTNTPVQTPVAPETLSGYVFGYWRVNGIRQADPLGLAANPVTFLLTTNTVATAYYFPERDDLDTDGIPDWFEWRYEGRLDAGASSDADHDGFNLNEEFIRGTHPNLVDTIWDGGISRHRSQPFFINLQPFERLEFALVDNVLTRFFSFWPATVTGRDFGTNTAPALGDWDGDGDPDLFVAAGRGVVTVFENVGSKYTLNLSDRTAAFSAFAPSWSGIANPALALGDWSGDEAADLAIGGDTGIIRLIPSTGRFTSLQTPAGSYRLDSGSSKAVPALGDITGDGRSDLLLLLADGTVNLYPHTGDAGIPFDSATVISNILGQTVPGATGFCAADINSDGHIDVLVSDEQGRVWEFHQTALGSFTLQSKVWAGTGNGFAARLTISAGDIDGDGDVDLVGGFSDGGLVGLRDPRLAIPSNLRAFGGAISIRLQWDPDRQSRVIGYFVYRSSSISGPFAKLNATPLTAPAFEDINVSAGERYYYRVTAATGALYPGNSVPVLIESQPSETVSALVGIVALWMPDYFGAPGARTVLQVNCNQATGISGAGLDIRVIYDASLLTPISQVNPAEPTVEKTALTADLGITDNGATANGEIRIQGTGGGVITGQGNMFDIRFHVRLAAPPGARATNSFSYVSLRGAGGLPLSVDYSDTAVFTVSLTYFPGDVNGDGILSQPDFVLAMKLAVGQRPSTPNELAAGDLNGNGLIDKDDAHMILRMVHDKDPNPR